MRVTITLSVDSELKEEAYKLLKKNYMKPSHFFEQCLESFIKNQKEVKDNEKEIL